METTTSSTPLAPPPLPTDSGPVSPSPASGPRARWRDLAGPALFEAAFVVLGVVLALAANEWRESREHRAAAENARVAIANELRANRELAVKSREYHREVMQAVFTAPPTVAMFSKGFILPAQLSTTAWDVASQTGALAYLPYESVLAISQAVALERRYDAMSVSTGQLIYSELYRTGPMGVAANGRNLGSIIGAFTYREDQVIAKIDSTLAVIEARKK